MLTDPNTLTQEQPQPTRLQRQTTLTRISDLIRTRGASERTFQAALHDFHTLLQPPSTPNTDTPGQRLSDLQSQPIQWLWQKHIPQGKLTLLEGEPGIGTSLLALTIAAAVSTGHPMLDGTPGPQGQVILITPQESPADTLKPRLEAAGGDPTEILLLNTIEALDAQNVTLYDRPFSLNNDLNLLEEAITRANARLVIIDPLATVTRNTNSKQMHERFTLLAQLAERTNCAILLIRHLKSGLPSRQRNQDAGFPGLIASVRHILHLSAHPDDSKQRILISTKHTLSAAPATLGLLITEPTPGVPSFHCFGELPPHQLSQHDLTALSSQRQAIIAVLQDTIHPLTPTEIAQRTNQPNDSVRLLLSRMVDAGEILRPARGYYIAHQHRSLLNQQPTDTPDTSDTTPLSSDHRKGGGRADEGVEPLRSPSGFSYTTGDISYASATLDTSDTTASSPDHCKGGDNADEGLEPLQSPSGVHTSPDTLVQPDISDTTTPNQITVNSTDE